MLIVAILGPWSVLLLTNAVLGEPERRRRADHCTRYCHDHGCSHDPVLPDALTGDHGLYGWTIDNLYTVGDHSGLRRDLGYGLANLVLFCVVWPAGMLALLAVGLHQRIRLRATRGRR